MAITDEQIEKHAIAITKQEKQEWETATAFVTEKIAFRMRDLIRALRMNYYGIHEKPLDPVTGRRKIWYPLTEIFVEASIKNFGLDIKDFNYRAKTFKGIPFTEITRVIVHDVLRGMYFGEEIDLDQRTLAIDGTTVRKTWEGKGKDRKTALQTDQIDLLNFYIDPTAKNIQDTAAVIERAVVDVNEFRSYDWDRVNEVEGTTDLHRNIPDLSGTNTSGGKTKMVEVFERWGLIPKWLITGDEEDQKSGEMVEGHIVISDLDHHPRVHLIETNEKGWKPYEEAWFTRVPGRWYGKGIAEKLLMPQLWVNIVVNLRINKNYISQLGIFKVRNNSGITPQMVSRLASNGAIKVNDMDDIQQLVIQEAGATSYKDEETVQNLAERLTSAFEIVTGEQLPSSTPATNAVLQDRNARSMFTMIRESLGMYYERWMNRHALPIIAKNIKKSDIVRVMRDDSNIEEIRERVITHLVEEKINEIEDEGKIISPLQLQDLFRNAEEKLAKRGELFFEVAEEIISEHVDADLYMTNEEMDVGVVSQNIINMLPTEPDPEIQRMLRAQLFDLMGIEYPRKETPTQAIPGQGETSAAPAGDVQVPETLQSLVTDANVG